jgi:hypothetical protein
MPALRTEWRGRHKFSPQGKEKGRSPQRSATQKKANRRFLSMRAKGPSTVRPRRRGFVSPSARKAEAQGSIPRICATDDLRANQFPAVCRHGVHIRAAPLALDRSFRAAKQGEIGSFHGNIVKTILMLALAAFDEYLDHGKRYSNKQARRYLHHCGIGVSDRREVGTVGGRAPLVELRSVIANGKKIRPAKLLHRSPSDSSNRRYSTLWSHLGLQAGWVTLAGFGH